MPEPPAPRLHPARWLCAAIGLELPTGWVEVNVPALHLAGEYRIPAGTQMLPAADRSRPPRTRSTQPSPH